MKFLLFLILSIFILNSCAPGSEKEYNDIPLNNTVNMCVKETGIFKEKLENCGVFDRSTYKGQGAICMLYDENYQYSDSQVDESRNCIVNIENLSCDNLSVTSKLADVDTCPSFKDKSMKSKKQICAENYFLFCQKQFDKCGESHLDSKCEGAKYTKTNNIGKDAHTSFKMEKLLEYCESEGNNNAEYSDLDCLLASNRSIGYDVCQENVSFADFRNECNKFE